MTLVGNKMMAKVKTIGIPIIYRSLSPVFVRRITFKPFNMIVTVIIAKTPPMTGAGIADRKADNLVKKPKIMNQIPADIKTRLLATPVMETMPALVE